MIDAYVYRVTNKITGQFYYGYRYKNQKLNLKMIFGLHILHLQTA